MPRARFKSDVEHLVPLSDDALTVLASVPQVVGCDFLFSNNGRTPFNNADKAKARLDKLVLEELRAAARRRGDDEPKQLTPWVNHDLRRVLRTNLSAFGVADHIAEMCLGHGRHGLQRVYDQHRYVVEQRRAFEAWAAKVRALLEPAPSAPRAANVVTIRARR